MVGRLRGRWSWLRGFAAAKIGAPLASPLRFLRSPRQILSIWPDGDIPLSKRVALFVHFDRRGEVRDYVLAYLRSLAEAGLSVVFVSNAGRLTPQAQSALQDICAAIVVRRNIGYDFGAWREGLERLHLPRPDTELVVLANDSVYGPLDSLQASLSGFDFGRADIWGLTDSWQNRYHLQSYFLGIGPTALNSLAWRNFWQCVRPAPSKHYVIQRYEVGLTQAMLRAGMRVEAIWPYQSLIALCTTPNDSTVEDANKPQDVMTRKHSRRTHLRYLQDAVSRRQPLNPTSDLWRQLLESRFPFLKRELLRDNPTLVSDIVEWRNVVQHIDGRSLDIIDQDLRRTLRNQAP